MSDLLARCDWDEDELHVYIAEWPEVVYVWVDEKTMPYAPVVADVRSLQAETKALRELARDLYECASHANEQDWFHFERHMLGCGMSCTVNGEGCGLSVLADRMHDLGVEVE